MPLKKNPSYEKIKRKVTGLFLNAIRNTPLQFAAYKSYWHSRLYKSPGENPVAGNLHYIAQKPNHGAGIGHQLANWNTGFYYAGFYHLAFAHFAFSNNKWEQLLGFGENETSVITLLKDRDFKKIRLPRFDSEKQEEVAMIGNIIQSYKKNKVLFLLAQDQGYMRQCDTFSALSDKFFHAAARKENKLFYTAGNFNIAIHIRRGDVAAMKQAGDTNWKERWLNNDYYAAVLKNALAALATQKNIQIYLFSQGAVKDFPEFTHFDNVHFCLDVNAYDSFVHMVYADILISSKSSFSYKPALISKGIKIYPANFWHAYPSTGDFIMAGEDGAFDREKLYPVKNTFYAAGY
jgi:hypothetical protein